MMMKLTSSSDEDTRAFADQLYDWTIPGLLKARALHEPDAVAIRYKSLGIYQELDWSSYLERVDAVAAGLHRLGFERGDRLAIMGDPSIEWVLADLAAVSLGGISYGVYSTCSPEQVGFQVAEVGARFFVAGDQEHLDKLLLAGPEGDAIEHILVADDRTLFRYSDDRIMSFSDLEESGRIRLRQGSDFLEERKSEIEPDDVAIITFTSGTTGPPKAAVHAHRDALVGMTFPYLYFYDELRGRPHRTVTYLALAHLVERSMSVWLPLISDCVPHIGQKGEGLRRLLYETQPTFLHGVPRIWEKLSAQVVVEVDSASALHRKTFEYASKMGRSWLEKEWSEDSMSTRHRLMKGLARRIAFFPALHKIGMAEVEAGLSGGAPIPPRVQALWQSWGVPLRNVYGITEGTTVGGQSESFPRPEDPMFPAYPKVVEIAPDGEVLVRGRGLFVGYWGDAEATDEALENGTLHTGDIAETVEGGFRIVDRKKDIMITSGGKNLSPAEIENALKASPYMSEAIVIADGRKFPSCLVEIDFDTVSQWAGHNNVSFAGFSDLARNDAVVDLIGSEIAAANQQLARVEQVKKYRILPKILDPEVGDTTPTRKVKRGHIQQMFSELIEDMYGNGPTRGTGPRSSEAGTV